jgi:peptidoglycan/LPS O-acetylase OafA/YrhL
MQQSWIGVQGFFTLSGFIITDLLVREWGCTGSISIARFYGRRFLKIVPPLLFQIALVLTLCGSISLFHQPGMLFSVPPLGSESYRQTIQNLPWFLGFVGNYAVIAGIAVTPVIGISWTLAIEEQFYAIQPSLLKLLTRWKDGFTGCVFALFGSLLVVPLLYRLWLLGPHSSAAQCPEEVRTVIFHSTLTQVDSISAGVLAAMVWRSVAPRIREWRPVRWKSLILEPLIHPATQTVALVCYLLILDRFERFRYGWGYTFLNLLSAGCILANLVRYERGPSPSYPAFVRGMSWLGKKGYALYLMHPLAVMLSYAAFPLNEVGTFSAHAIRSAGRYTVGLCLSIALAFLLWHAVERPLQKFRRNRFP